MHYGIEMLDVKFEKKTKRLVLRPYRETDFIKWKETFSSVPKAKNRWDKGPRPLDELTEGKFRKILSTQKKNRNDDVFYDFIAFDKKSGEIIGFVSLMDISRAVFKILIWVTVYFLQIGERGMEKRWSMEFLK